jgi:uncharacterized protein (TIGR04255 family)
MGDLHPEYPQPTIQEALCEIHFDLPQGTPWRSTLPGDLFIRLQPDYPQMEPLCEIGFDVEAHRGEAGQLILPVQGIRYTHASRPLHLHLAEGVFAVSVLSPYPGWPAMREDILRTWTIAREVVAPAAVTRVGLNYVNEIARHQTGEPANVWLKPGPFVPPAVLSSGPGFYSRVQATNPQDDVCVVTVGETESEEPGAQGMTFDIGCTNEEIGGIDDESIRWRIDRLHEAVWGMFSAALTPQLEQQLQGR